MMIADGYLFYECHTCDGFGWYVEDDDEERPDYLPPTEMQRIWCQACKGLGIVKVRVEDIQTKQPEKEPT